ncbi:MAG: choice-of-anchor V domain-containing protein [Acidobacteriota bacterium]
MAFLLVASLEARLDGREIPTNEGVLGATPCFTSNCHQAPGSTFNSGGSVTFNNLPGSFVPGQTYDIAVTITGGTVYGLQGVTVFSDNTQAGTLTPLTSGVTVHSPPDANGVQFLVHSLKPLNTGTVNFRWTAPTNPKEANVIFKVASNSANNSISPTGDKINTLQEIVPQQQLSEKLYFAQFADGGGLFSQITLVNLSSTIAVNGKIEMFDDNGNPLLVGLNGPAVTQLDFSITAAASAIFKTDGVGEVQVGSVIVSSDRPLAAVILFVGSGLGVAGVGSSQALQSFLAPMDMNVQKGILTGIAIMNLESTAQTIQVQLLDLDGNVVTSGTLGAGPLPGNGHIARFLNEEDFQFQGSPDLSNFQGTLRVTASSGQIAATVIRQSPGEFATLPVAQPQ